MDYQKKYMKYKKKYLRLIGKLTGGLKYPQELPDPSKIISENDIYFPAEFTQKDPSLSKKEIFQWRHTLDICKDAAGTGSLNNVITILNTSQLFQINGKSPLNVNFGQPGNSDYYKTHLDYFEQTILLNVKKNLTSTPWIKTTQSQAQQLKYNYDTSLWECGRSPRSYINQVGLYANKPTIILSTFAGYMDPLEKDPKNTVTTDKYPTGSFEYTLNKNDMTLLGFKDCAMSVHGKYDTVFGSGWDQVGFKFTFETPTLGTITITRPEGLTPQQPNPNIPNPITINSRSTGDITIRDIKHLVIGNNNIKTALETNLPLEQKLTYILIKLLGDWGQVIFYFIIKKLIPSKSIIMVTCDMVVYCLCITLGLECIYNAKNNNFPNDIRQSGSKDLVLYTPVKYTAAQAAFVNFKSKLLEIYNRNKTLTETIEILKSTDLTYQDIPIKPDAFIDGVVEDIKEINRQFYTEVGNHGIDLGQDTQIDILSLAPGYVPYDPAQYSTIAEKLKEEYECINIFIIKGKRVQKTLTIKSGKTSYTLKKNHPKPGLNEKMNLLKVSCKPKDNFRQIFYNYYKKISGLHGGYTRLKDKHKAKQEKYSNRQGTRKDILNKIRHEARQTTYNTRRINFEQFQTDVNFEQFQEDETFQENLRNNMKILINKLENDMGDDFLNEIPPYEKNDNNNIIILEDWVTTIFIYFVQSNLITNFDEDEDENKLWSDLHAQHQLAYILTVFYENNYGLFGGGLLIETPEDTCIKDIKDKDIEEIIFHNLIKKIEEHKNIFEIIMNIEAIFNDFLNDSKCIYNSIEKLSKLMDKVNFILQEYIRFLKEDYKEEYFKDIEKYIKNMYQSFFSEYKNKSQDDLRIIMQDLLQGNSAICDYNIEEYTFNKIMILQIATYFMLMFYKKNLFDQKDLDLMPPTRKDFLHEYLSVSEDEKPTNLMDVDSTYPYISMGEKGNSYSMGEEANSY